MAKCKQLTPLPFKGLRYHVVSGIEGSNRLPPKDVGYAFQSTV